MLYMVVENTSLSLVKHGQMLEIQDSQMSIQKETLEEIKGFRKDTSNYLEHEFEEIKRKLNAIENALSREGITV